MPGVQTLRRIKHGGLNRKVRELSRSCGGRLIYHEPNMIARPVSLPTVVTMNDLSWHHEPSWHPAERLQWIDRNLKATLRQATRFVAISQFTKDAVVRDLGIAASRIDVIPLAPAEDFQPISAEDAAGALARYDLADHGYVYEGFGLPVVEAMATASPVLASSTTAVGELAAGAALMVDPEDETAITQGLQRLIEDTDLAEQLRQAGLARAAEYSWQRTIETLIVSWRQALP